MKRSTRSAPFDETLANLTLAHHNMSTHFPFPNNTSDEFVYTTLTYLITEKPIKDFKEYQYATVIRQYASIVICIMGVVGNCFSILILFQEHNRKMSCYLYFGVITITDNILLINAGIYQCLVDFSPERINEAVCRLVNGLWYGSSFGSTYFLFFATLDR